MAWNSSHVFDYDNESGYSGSSFFMYFNEFSNVAMWTNIELTVLVILFSLVCISTMVICIVILIALVIGYEEPGLGEREYNAKMATNSYEFSDVTTWKIIQLNVSIILFFASLFCNSIIALNIISFQDQQTITNCLVFNAIVADLVYVLTIPPVEFSSITKSWLLGDSVCKLIPYTQLVSGVVLSWTVALMGLHRYKCIAVSASSRSMMTMTQAIIFCFSSWLIASFITAPALFWFRQQETQNSTLHNCTIDSPKSEHINFVLIYKIFLILIASVIPMIFLVYFYEGTFRTVLLERTSPSESSCTRPEGKHQRRQSDQARHNSTSKHEKSQMNKHEKVVRHLAIDAFVTLLMWLPLTATIVFIFIDDMRSNEDAVFLDSLPFCVLSILAHIGTVLNPLLYGALSGGFMVCLKRLVSKDSRKRRREPENNRIFNRTMEDHHDEDGNVIELA